MTSKAGMRARSTSITGVAIGAHQMGLQASPGLAEISLFVGRKLGRPRTISASSLGHPCPQHPQSGEQIPGDCGELAVAKYPLLIPAITA
jgi:hypothetical protein